MAGKLDQTAAKLNTGDSRTDSPRDSRGLRALKILVVVMGIMIIAGVATIVVTIVSRLSDKARQIDEKRAGQTIPPATIPPAMGAPFGDIAVALPSGARVISVSASVGRLYVHYETTEGVAAVLVLNGVDGAKLGTLRFEPAR